MRTHHQYSPSSSTWTDAHSDGTRTRPLYLLPGSGSLRRPVLRRKTSQQENNYIDTGTAMNTALRDTVYDPEIRYLNPSRPGD